MKTTQTQSTPPAEKSSAFGTVIVAISAILFIGIAAILLFVPQIKVIDICYAVCGAVIILGIYMIVRYFMTNAFVNMNAYGFSGGALLVVLGVCGMIRAQDVAGVFILFVGIALLFSCVVKLQYALDMQRINAKIWIVLFILTLALTGCSVAIILNPFENEVFYQQFACYVMLVDGIVSLLTIVLLAICLKAYRRKQERIASGEPEKVVPAPMTEAEAAAVLSEEASSNAADAGDSASAAVAPESSTSEPSAEESAKPDVSSDNAEL